MGSPATSASRPARAPAEQRVHHITHLDNLAAILSAGRLLADRGAAPLVDISTEQNRAARRASPVAGASAADFVPFFFGQNAAVWEAIRAGGADPRLSPAIRAMPAAAFIVLVTTLGAIRQDLRHAAFVVADGDPLDAATRVAVEAQERQRLVHQILGDGQPGALADAELLVRDAVPIEAITLIGVANVRVRERVRELLAETEYRPRVAVHPPWFATPTP